MAVKSVLAAAKQHFVVEKIDGGAGDLAKQQAVLDDTLAHQPAFVVSFAADKDAWKLTLSPDVTPTALGISVHRALQKYDPIVFEQVFLASRCKGTLIDFVPDAWTCLIHIARLRCRAAARSIAQTFWAFHRADKSCLL